MEKKPAEERKLTILEAKEIRELRKENDSLRKEKADTVAEKNQALDQVTELQQECKNHTAEVNKLKEDCYHHNKEKTKLKVECNNYRAQINTLEAERRRQNEITARLEEECLGYQTRVSNLESQLQLAHDLDGRTCAAEKQVQGLSQKIYNLQDDFPQYSILATEEENNVALVTTEPNAQISIEELAALRHAVRLGLVSKAKAARAICDFMRITSKEQCDSGEGVFSVLPMLCHIVSDLDNTVEEIVERLESLSKGAMK